MPWTLCNLHYASEAPRPFEFFVLVSNTSPCKYAVAFSFHRSSNIAPLTCYRTILPVRCQLTALPHHNTSKSCYNSKTPNCVVYEQRILGLR